LLTRGSKRRETPGFSRNFSLIPFSQKHLSGILDSRLERLFCTLRTEQ